MKKLKGSITVYLSLILVIVMTLICSLVESGRVSAINMKLRGITYMAMDSMFSGYVKPLFEDYGVMFLWSSEEDFLEELNSYVDDNLSVSKLGITRKADLYGTRRISSSLSVVKWATDDGGAAFKEQVCEYMKYYLIENAAEKLLEKTGLFEQGGKVSQFIEKIQSYGDIFKKVEETVGDINSLIIRMKKATENPKDLLEKMLEKVQKYIETDDPSFTLDFSSYYSKLKTSKNILKGYLKSIREETENYYEAVDEAKKATDELESELKAGEEEYEPEIYSAVKEQIDEIKEKSADTDFDYYEVGINKEKTYEYEERIDRLDGFFEEADYTLNKENAEDTRKTLEKYLKEFDGFSLDDLNVNIDTAEVEHEDDSFLDSIKDMFEKGLLAFIAGDVSEKSVDSSEFPSVTSMGNYSGEKESLIKAAADKALFSEYLNTHFGRFTETKDGTALDYEAEYVIGGKDSDKDNLAAVVTDIVLLRSGCNLISILKDSKKKAETLELATAIAGYTGMPIVVKIVQILIISAWSLAESMADAKALLAGKKVPAIKGSDDWYLSLEGIKNFSEESINNGGSDKGLTYEDYLRIMFLMQNEKVQIYRTMDLIQANLCLNENSSFRIKDCMTAVEAEIEYKSAQLFAGAPFSGGNGGYLIKTDQQYKY